MISMHKQKIIHRRPLDFNIKRYEHAKFIRFYQILKGVGVAKIDINQKMNDQSFLSLNIFGKRHSKVDI